MHSEHRRDFSGPRARGVDEGVGRDALPAGENDGAHFRGFHVGSDDAILDVHRTELRCLAPEAPEQAVGIAPAVVRRVRAGAQVVDTHRREPGRELAGRQKIDRATMIALPAHVALELRGVLGRHDEQVAAFHPVHRRGSAVGRHRLLESLDEAQAEERHLDVFGAGELHAAAAGRAQRRGELVGGIGLDDADRQRWRFREQEVGGGAADDATADDRNVEPRRAGEVHEAGVIFAQYRKGAR